MKLASLQDLLLDQIKDIYNAEGQMLKALPRMAKACSNEALREAFEEHLEQTRGQVERLEEVFQQMGQAAKGKKCHAIEGLIEEAKELMAEDAEAGVLDAGLIAAAQKVEHYEIASYGCAATWADQLGLNEVADLLRETLDEEKTTDERLTQIAESMVNLEAEDAGEGEGEEAMAAGTQKGGKGGSKSGGKGGSKGRGNSRSSGRR